MGPRGLEVTIATPWAVSFLLGILVLAGMIITFVIVLITVQVTGAMPESYLQLLDIVFGRTWLWLGLGFAAVLIFFDRFSNEQYIFGHHLVEYRFRSGSIVLNSRHHPLSWISHPTVDGKDDRWRVTWRWRSRPGSRTWMRAFKQCLSRNYATGEKIHQSIRNLAAGDAESWRPGLSNNVCPGIELAISRRNCPGIRN
jgi:hypothetical protein